ncbi:MAG TPA: hypothetical protein VG755_04420 [Nannocystaceae bacterium]|nr:hypothetical protein [Nannocystaceae bacterium]
MLAAITTALALTLAPATTPSEPVDPPADEAKPDEAKPDEAKPEVAKKPEVVSPPPPRPVEPYKPTTMPGQGRGARVGFVIAGSIVLAGGLALAGTMGWAIAQSQQLERDGERAVGGDPQHANRDELDRILRDGRRMNRTAIWTGVAAGVAISSAIGILVSASRSRTRTVTPTASRGGAGLLWSVRF